LVLLCTVGCGHVIRPELAPNWRGFDFAKPPCPLSPRPEPEVGQVALRYLGAGGLYIEWQGTALLMSPFFSNPGILRARFGRLATNAEAVRRGLDGMDLSRVRAVAAGHSHYDHLGDLPTVAEKYAPAARIYVNQTGFNALAPIASLAGRVASLEGEEGRDWIWLRDAQGNRAPIRFRKVESEHAPQFFHYRFAAGEIDGRWTEDWTHRRYSALKGGTAFAFVIDLMSQDLQRIRFRMYYQDAANAEGKGLPRLEDVQEHGFDLAVLCMASYPFVHRHPESILGRLQPRHVLVAHYEDFFRDPRKPVRFVFPLTNAAADKFLFRVKAALPEEGNRGPIGHVCGASSPGWTVPMPGEWMLFRVDS
jgi:L-ascorbate metabolism protein UlaG (beta-lactamase superfamily)